MKAEIKEKWVAALRSGTFRQGTACLGKTTGERCCLGVLCDLAIEAGLPIKLTTLSHKDGYEMVGYNGSFNLLPESVAKWAGCYFDPKVEISEEQDERYKKVTGSLGSHELLQLSAVNDAGFNFNEIADLIENHLIKGAMFAPID